MPAPKPTLKKTPGSLNSDYPMAAYTRAIRAFDEYDACVTEYRALLDVQRALLASENTNGLMQTVARADTTARRAEHCGRRIAPVRDTLSSGAYRGMRTDELNRRLAASGTMSAEAAACVAQLTAACVIKRDAAATELSRDQTVQQTRGRAAYGTASRSTMAIDIRR